MRLPDPDDAVARARESNPDDAAVNLAVAGQVDARSVERTGDGYAGPGSGPLGRLAAAVAADAPVHFPDPDFTAEGPWLVLAPLGGFVSTVATGAGRAAVTLDYDPDGDPALRDLEDRVSALLDAARPTHDHYPVESDDRGVFTLGMTTFTLDSLAVDDDLTATFEVRTTPATDPGEVESRFADVDAVERVTYETVAGVERADPSRELRGAVEAAHRDVLGDCEYEWLPEGGVFEAVPGGNKVALGTGSRGAEAFSADEYETCVELLGATLAELGVSA